MSTHARGSKTITKPATVQTATDVSTAIIAKTDAPQTLKDKAAAVQTFIGAYNSAFDGFNAEVPVIDTKATSVNGDFTALKVAYAELKHLAKGLVSIGMINPADYGTLLG